MARESGLVRRFLKQKQPKGWSEVRVVSQVQKDKVVAVRVSQPKPSSGRLPIKRSRRILENQRKTLFRKRLDDKRAKKILKQDAEKAHKLVNQQRRREIRKIINEELVNFAYVKIREKISKTVSPKLKMITNKIMKMQQEIATLSDVVEQVNDWRQEASDMIDNQRNHYDTLVANIEEKVDQSVVDFANKLKKKYRKIAADVEKTSKEVSILGDRVDQIVKNHKKPNAENRIRRGKLKSCKRSRLSRQLKLPSCTVRPPQWYLHALRGNHGIM